MKQRFLTGLMIILPLAITFWIISFIINLCTKPFEPIVSNILYKLNLFQSQWWLFSSEQIHKAATIVAIIVGLIFILFIIGIIGQWIFFNILLKAIDHLCLRIPIVNKIYKACQEITHILFRSESSSFSNVVWSPFPTSKQRTIGLVTNSVSLPIEPEKVITYKSVLIPGTPNPTIGLLIFCPNDTIISTSLTVDKAMKWLISCGSSETKTIMESTLLKTSKLA